MLLSMVKTIGQGLAGHPGVPWVVLEGRGSDVELGFLFSFLLFGDDCFAFQGYLLSGQDAVL